MWIAFNVDASKANNTCLLELVGVGINMEVWPELMLVSFAKWRISHTADLLSTNQRRSQMSWLASTSIIRCPFLVALSLFQTVIWLTGSELGMCYLRGTSIVSDINFMPPKDSNSAQVPVYVDGSSGSHR